LIIITAYFPLFTLQRGEAALFTPMAYTVGFACLGALLCTLALVPGLSYMVLRRPRRAFRNIPLEWLGRAYRATLTKLLNWPSISYVATAAAFLAVGIMAPLVGRDYLPDLDEGGLWLQVQMPSGLSLDTATEMASELRRAVLANLADEKGWGDATDDHPEHAELWLDFVEGMGASRSLRGHEPLAEIRHLTAFFHDVARDGMPEEALAAFYAYESQVPRVAQEKARGLLEIYGADDRTCRCGMFAIRYGANANARPATRPDPNGESAVTSQSMPPASECPEPVSVPFGYFGRSALRLGVEKQEIALRIRSMSEMAVNRSYNATAVGVRQSKGRPEITGGLYFRFGSEHYFVTRKTTLLLSVFLGVVTATKPVVAPTGT
jgi:hypothetical protein